MIVPSGNRRQMESQSYLYNEHDGQVESIIETMLRKAAALDIDPTDAVGELGTQRPQAGPTRAPVDQSQVADAMDQSNSLPPKVPETQAGRFESKVNQVAQDVLGSLDLDPGQWTTNTNVSSGAGGEVETISINLKRSAKKPDEQLAVPHS